VHVLHSIYCIHGQMPIPPVLPNDQNAAITIRDCIRLSHREGLDDTTLLAYSNVLIQGMRVPLGTPVVKAWQLLQHPDRFLYVVLQPAAAVTSVS
jgi:Autophagy protein Apg5